MLNRWLVTLLILILSGCQSQKLVVETRFIQPQTRASYWVHSPDPYLCCPEIGQELIVSWNLPSCYFENPPLELLVSMRFGNREEERVSLKNCKRKGIYIHELLNGDYWCRQGILSYKVEAFSNGCRLGVWKHQLWADRLVFDETVDDFGVFEED